MNLNLTSQNVTANVTQVYGAQGSAGAQVQFINQSTTVTVYLGFTPTVLGGTGPSIPLNPGASITLSGAISYYGVTLGGTAILSVVPGGIAYFSPGAFISPLFTSTGAYVIPFASAYSPMVLTDVSGYSSYDITLAVYDNSQANANHARACNVTLQWYDDMTSGIPLFTETWNPWVSNVTNTAPAVGSGPMHGQYMTVTIANPSPTNSIAVGYVKIFGSQRNTQLGDWRQAPSQAFDGTYHVIPNTGVGFDNMLADTNGLIALSPSTDYMLPFDLYSGPVYWALQWGANINVTRSNIVNIGSNASTQTSGNLTPQANSLAVIPETAGGSFNGSFLLPRSACALLLQIGVNGGTMEFTMVAQQGP